MHECERHQWGGLPGAGCQVCSYQEQLLSWAGRPPEACPLDVAEGYCVAFIYILKRIFRRGPRPPDPGELVRWSRA